MSVVVVDEQSACVLRQCDKCLFVFNAYNVADMYCVLCIFLVHDICFHFCFDFFVGNRPLLIANTRLVILADHSIADSVIRNTFAMSCI